MYETKDLGFVQLRILTTGTVPSNNQLNVERMETHLRHKID